jgi:ATPase, PilT family
VPEGLMEEDLARPVIVISDFETGRAEYEIYTFNRQVVTVPIGDEEQGGRESGVDRIAKDEIEREIRSIARGHVEVELHDSNTAVVWVEENDISTVIGKGGSRISDVEDRLGISIDVRTLADRTSTNGRGSQTGQTQTQAQTQPSGSTRTGGIAVAPEITDRHVVIPIEGHAGDTVEVRADSEYLFTATVSRGGEVQVSRGSAIAEELEGAIDNGRTVTVTPS